MNVQRKIDVDSIIVIIRPVGMNVNVLLTHGGIFIPKNVKFSRKSSQIFSNFTNYHI